MLELRIRQTTQIVLIVACAITYVQFHYLGFAFYAGWVLGDFVKTIKQK
jgi:hypothetical protein